MTIKNIYGMVPKVSCACRIPLHSGSTVKLIRVGEGECEVPRPMDTRGVPCMVSLLPLTGAATVALVRQELAWSLRLGKRRTVSARIGPAHDGSAVRHRHFQRTGKVYEMTTTFDLPRPLPSGYLEQEQNGMFRTDSEMSLVL